MLTPVEMQGRSLKSGFGYKKHDIDDFLEEIFESYEQLYKENVELKDKLAVLNEGMQYYKDLESTLQKTLLVAEKTAEATKNASLKKAAAIEKNATIKAQMTLSDAKKAMDKIQNQTVILMQQFENYRQQYKQILNAQMELLDSKAYSLPPFEPINLEIPSFDATSDTEDLAAVARQIADVEDEAEEAIARKSVAEVFADTTNEIFEAAEEEAAKEEIIEEVTELEAVKDEVMETGLEEATEEAETPAPKKNTSLDVEESFEFLDI